MNDLKSDMFSYNNLYAAYEIANFRNDPEVMAYVNIKDEKIVILESEEFCESAERKKAERALKKGEWIELPQKSDLGLGRDLVFCFAEEHFPVNERRFFAGMFSRSDAYGNRHDFLECKGLLNKWHQFENAEEDKVLKEWLTGMEISFQDNCAEKIR